MCNEHRLKATETITREDIRTCIEIVTCSAVGPARFGYMTAPGRDCGVHVGVRVTLSLLRTRYMRVRVMFKTNDDYFQPSCDDEKQTMDDVINSDIR